jgi:hypothetical protein
MLVIVARMRPWLLWAGGTVASVVVSYLVWWYWGTAFCGDESLPSSAGDALCQALVDPVWPWAVVAAIPTLLALVGGLVGLVSRRPRLFTFSLVAPVALGVLTLSLAPALF